jgi:hypothetical protein
MLVLVSHICELFFGETELPDGQKTLRTLKMLAMLIILPSFEDWNS